MYIVTLKYSDCELSQGYRQGFVGLGSQPCYIVTLKSCQYGSAKRFLADECRGLETGVSVKGD